MVAPLSALLSSLIRNPRAEPTLHFFDAHPFAPGIILHLIAVERPGVIVRGVRMRQINPRHRCCRVHRQRLGKADARVSLNIEKLPNRALLGMIGTGGIARRRPDASVSLADERIIVMFLILSGSAHI